MSSRGGGHLVPGTIKDLDAKTGGCERSRRLIEYSFTLTRADSEDMSHEGEAECDCRPGGGGEDMAGVPQIIPRSCCFDSHNLNFSRRPK